MRIALAAAALVALTIADGSEPNIDIEFHRYELDECNGAEVGKKVEDKR